jgi:hypothetical protein
MPRTMRVEYPGAIYHGMNRGDREDIFQSDNERQRFLETLGQAWENTDRPGRKMVVCEHTLG